MPLGPHAHSASFLVYAIICLVKALLSSHTLHLFQKAVTAVTAFNLLSMYSLAFMMSEVLYFSVWGYVLGMFINKVVEPKIYMKMAGSGWDTDFLEKSVSCNNPPPLEWLGEGMSLYVYQESSMSCLFHHSTDFAGNGISPFQSDPCKKHSQPSLKTCYRTAVLPPSVL